MKEYRVNEIFYSLQGEGRWAGRAAVFVRFSGCNLKCPFCDTDFADKTPMTAQDILQAVEPWKECHFMVLTGGESTLQVDEELVDMLHWAGFYVSMETNGTREVPRNIDWVTCSPKIAYVPNGALKLKRANEVKVVYDGKIGHEPDDFGIEANEYYVQPCDSGFISLNNQAMAKCVEWVKEHPKWKLSLQQQKILKVR